MVFVFFPAKREPGQNVSQFQTMKKSTPTTNLPIVCSILLKNRYGQPEKGQGKEVYQIDKKTSDQIKKKVYRRSPHNCKETEEESKIKL